jgi:hypothetical protein
MDPNTNIHADSSNGSDQLTESALKQQLVTWKAVGKSNSTDTNVRLENAASFSRQNSGYEQSAAKAKRTSRAYNPQSTDDSENEGKGEKCETESDSDHIHPFVETSRNLKRRPIVKTTLNGKRDTGVVEWSDNSDNEDERSKRDTRSGLGASPKHRYSKHKQESGLSFQRSKLAALSGIFNPNRKSETLIASEKRPCSSSPDCEEERKPKFAKVTRFGSLEDKNRQTATSATRKIGQRPQFLIGHPEAENRLSKSSKENKTINHANSRSSLQVPSAKPVLSFVNSDEEGQEQALKTFAEWRAQRKKLKAMSSDGTAKAWNFKAAGNANGKIASVNYTRKVKPASQVAPELSPFERAGKNKTADEESKPSLP